MTLELATLKPFAAPVVDRLAVRVVVDSFYERFIRDAAHPACTIEHTRQIRGRQMSTLAGEWGLSLHLESVRAGTKAEYLLDFGYTPEVLNRNFDLLAIDPKRIKGLILSHGHRDHYGGLLGFVERYRGDMPGDLTLHVGADDAFREKWIGGKEGGGSPMSWGALDRAALAVHHVATHCCHAPHALEGPFSSGYIERTSFERLLPSTLVGEEDDDHFTEAERRGKLQPDQHPDEHATCYVIQGKGLAVISSCGHAGLINTIRTAMAVSNVRKLHAVLGGFHLGPAPLDYIQHTVDALEALAPDVVVPMHCSGPSFIAAARERMPDKVVTSNIGSRFTFG